MNKKTNSIVVVALLLIIVFSHLTVPACYKTEGGSCYQGITATILKFFLKLCGTLSLLSLVASYYSNSTASKALSIISFAIWLVVSLFIFRISTIFYFLPFLSISFIIMFFNIKKQMSK
jgi:hypothetical protein